MKTWFVSGYFKTTVVYFAIVALLTVTCCFLFSEIESEKYISLCSSACKKQLGTVNRIEFTTYAGYIKCNCYYENSFVGVVRAYRP